jgi:hypothetical protein
MSKWKRFRQRYREAHPQTSEEPPFMMFMDSCPDDYLLPTGGTDRAHTMVAVMAFDQSKYTLLRQRIESGMGRPLQQWKQGGGKRATERYRTAFAKAFFPAVTESGCFVTAITEYESTIRALTRRRLDELNCGSLCTIHRDESGERLRFPDIYYTKTDGSIRKIPAHDTDMQGGAILVWMATLMRIAAEKFADPKDNRRIHLVTDNIAGDDGKKGKCNRLDDLLIMLSKGRTRGRIGAGYITTESEEWLEMIPDNIAGALNTHLCHPGKQPWEHFGTLARQGIAGTLKWHVVTKIPPAEPAG